MAKVFNPPKQFNFECTSDDFGNYSKYEARCDKLKKALKAYCQEHAAKKSPLIGETITFPVADGSAEYMVYNTSPLQVIHLPIGDGYEADPILLRGLNLADVKQRVGQRKAMRKLFVS